MQCQAQWWLSCSRAWLSLLLVPSDYNDHDVCQNSFMMIIRFIKKSFFRRLCLLLFPYFFVLVLVVVCAIASQNITFLSSDLFLSSMTKFFLSSMIMIMNCISPFFPVTCSCHRWRHWAEELFHSAPVSPLLAPCGTQSTFSMSSVIVYKVINNYLQCHQKNLTIIISNYQQ